MKKYASTLLCSAFLFAGCTTAPERMDAHVALPDQWTSTPVAMSGAMTADWWQRFGSQELSALVEEAYLNNTTLAGAMSRVEQAHAVARMAGAPLLPAVQGQLSASQDKVQHVAMARQYGTGLTASYELDVWGKNSAASSAALATLTGAQYARDAVALTMTAGVVSTYLHTLGLRERVEIAQLNLITSERVLALVQSRERAGVATALELAQQKSLVASQRKNLVQRQQAAQDSVTALALLLGRAPQTMLLHAHSLAGMTAPAVDAGMPTDLLVRRPDLAQAERLLAAADANVAVARAAMLPQLTMTAGVGSQSAQWAELFRSPIYSLAAGIVAPIFSGGKLAAGRDAAIAQREELLSNYRGVIMNALGDVETALNAIDSLALQQAAQVEALQQAKEAVRLAESRYRSGAEVLLTVLDAQRTLYADQDMAAQLVLAQLQARVALFKALGGGWSMPAATAAS